MSRSGIRASRGIFVLLLLFSLTSRSGFAQESTSIETSLPPATPLNPFPAEAPFRPRKQVALRHRENLALFLGLSAGTYAAASLDMQETMAIRRNDAHFQEEDPLARPFTALPTPAYYAVGLAMTTGLNWVSFRMAHSQRWHRIWWLPQACAIGGNLFGYAYTKKSE